MTKVAKKIPGDRLVLAQLSVMRTLIMELHRRGVIDAHDLVTKIQETAITHREAGDPNRLADAIHAISEHLFDSISDDRGT